MLPNRRRKRISNNNCVWHLKWTDHVSYSSWKLYQKKWNGFFCSHHVKHKFLVCLHRCWHEDWFKFRKIYFKDRKIFFLLVWKVSAKNLSFIAISSVTYLIMNCIVLPLGSTLFQTDHFYPVRHVKSQLVRLFKGKYVESINRSVTCFSILLCKFEQISKSNLKMELELSKPTLLVLFPNFYP